MKIQGNNPIETRGQPARIEEIEKSREIAEKDVEHKTDDNKDRVTISEGARELHRNAKSRNSERVEETNKKVEPGENNHDPMKKRETIMDRI